jgi:hypothetical protein
MTSPDAGGRVVALGVPIAGPIGGSSGVGARVARSWPERRGRSRSTITRSSARPRRVSSQGPMP